MARTKPERRHVARSAALPSLIARWRHACAAATVMLVVLFAPHDPVVADGSTRVLDILLTNDDGFQAPGIRELQAALLAAGHRVTLIAPRDNQSGASARISTGPVSYREEAPGVWAVDGSPADAVAVGLQVIMGDRLPDLVVSGANFGHNVGATANVSGTVGAGLIAEYLGVPAVAVSVGMDFAEKAAQPTPFPSTLAAFPAAASFTAELVATLATAAGDGPLLPRDAILNVNYPVRPAAGPKGVRLASNGRYSAFSYDYEPTGKPNEVRLAFTSETAREPDPNADTTLFAAGYVTITVLDGELAANEEPARVASQRLQKLLQR
jgi:5'-nucleotidase